MIDPLCADLIHEGGVLGRVDHARAVRNVQVDAADHFLGALGLPGILYSNVKSIILEQRITRAASEFRNEFLEFFSVFWNQKPKPLNLCGLAAKIFVLALTSSRSINSIGGYQRYPEAGGAGGGSLVSPL